MVEPPVEFLITFLGIWLFFVLVVLGLMVLAIVHASKHPTKYTAIWIVSIVLFGLMGVFAYFTYVLVRKSQHIPLEQQPIQEQYKINAKRDYNTFTPDKEEKK